MHLCDDIQLDELYDQYNHVPHFPHWTTFSIDSMPIASCCGDTADALYQPKYEDSVLKITVIRSHLGMICGWAGPEPGCRSDGRLYTESLPWRKFSRQEYGLGDGAYSGRPKIVAPLRKPSDRDMPKQFTDYNKVHSFYRARIEQLFAILWTFALARNKWRGRETSGDTKLFLRVKILLNFIQFMLRRKVMYQPYGPWGHFPVVIRLPTLKWDRPAPSVCSGGRFVRGRKVGECYAVGTQDGGVGDWL